MHYSVVHGTDFFHGHDLGHGFGASRATRLELFTFDVKLEVE